MPNPAMAARTNTVNILKPKPLERTNKATKPISTDNQRPRPAETKATKKSKTRAVDAAIRKYLENK
jgi:hypothetical protein